MKLYELLNEEEKKALKELNVRNSYIKDITVEELTAMSDVIGMQWHSVGSVRSLEEIIHRQNKKI